MNEKGLIYEKLDALNIAYDTLTHPLAHTMDDLSEVARQLGAVIPKNLFLTPRNQSAFYLCLVQPDAVFKTADISKQIGASRLSFGPADKLSELLHTHPGAISPMGLALASAQSVRLLIDERLRACPRLGFHPNDNTETLAISGRDFFDLFLPATGFVPTYIHLEAFE